MPVSIPWWWSCPPLRVLSIRTHRTQSVAWSPRPLHCRPRPTLPCQSPRSSLVARWAYFWDCFLPSLRRTSLCRSPRPSFPPTLRTILRETRSSLSLLSSGATLPVAWSSRHLGCRCPDPPASSWKPANGSKYSSFASVFPSLRPFCPLVQCRRLV